MACGCALGQRSNPSHSSDNTRSLTTKLPGYSKKILIYRDKTYLSIFSLGFPGESPPPLALSPNCFFVDDLAKISLQLCHPFLHLPCFLRMLPQTRTRGARAKQTEPDFAFMQLDSGVQMLSSYTIHTKREASIGVVCKQVFPPLVSHKHTGLC